MGHIRNANGAKSTGVMNSLSSNDSRYQRFVRRSGEFMKPAGTTLGSGGLIGQDAQEVYSRLLDFRDKIDLVREVATQNRGQTPLPLCIEFSYLDSRLLFTDID